ncbi:hypothetical protein DENSPDRAFT_832948 [Dentipellis sp. KUC8613]|nr:hypothetical protein DENSPDRAFT_832948 [Dentipellis sp. KUC8613]
MSSQSFPLSGDYVRDLERLFQWKGVPPLIHYHCETRGEGDQLTYVVTAFYNGSFVGRGESNSAGYAQRRAAGEALAVCRTRFDRRTETSAK